MCPKYLCLSTVGYRSDLFQRDPNNVFITDFFGSQKRIDDAAEAIELPPLHYVNKEEEHNVDDRFTLHAAIFCPIFKF